MQVAEFVFENGNGRRTAEGSELRHMFVPVIFRWFTVLKKYGDFNRLIEQNGELARAVASAIGAYEVDHAATAATNS